MDGEEDRKNENILQDLRGLENLGRRAFSAARAVGTLASTATSEIWGPVAVVVFILAVATFSIVLGNQGQASETLPSQSITSTSGPVKNIHFYCQYDPAWTISSCQINHYGCDPTSLAMILSSFGRTDLTPLEVSAQNGNMGCSEGGTNTPQILDSIKWVKTQGFTVLNSVANGYNFDVDNAKKFIDEGYLILGIANVKFRTSAAIDNGGHSFVISNIDPQSKQLTVFDPTYCSSDSIYETKTMNINDVFCDSNMCGWLYAFPIKK